MSSISERSNQYMLKWPLLFAVAVIVGKTVIETAGVIAGGAVGLPEPALPIIALLLASAIALGLVWWSGWWRDSGFVTTVRNLPALTVPFLILFPIVIYFGVVEMDGPVFGFLLLLFFLTGLSEEVFYRGFLLRLFLPRGRVYAVVVTAVLFGLSHLPQLLQGLTLTDNAIQITQAIIFGLLYGAVRLRIDSIWPLVFMHMLFDVSAAIGGVFGPTAVRTISDIPLALWLVILVPSLIAAGYYLWKPSTATIDGHPISEQPEQPEPTVGGGARPG
ncbi:CPBP family intramembrane glutamic endopeptidase [Haloferax sp. DFSO52]|uniref:CPBP family intramembrane glutamic endopeptidase n=1 Tax=Haloferax sp. DFSO52 TaxID=3388505 RepID=UPI003A83650A